MTFSIFISLLPSFSHLSPPLLPFYRASCCRLVTRYAFWLRAHPTLLPMAFEFVVQRALLPPAATTGDASECGGGGRDKRGEEEGGIRCLSACAASVTISPSFPASFSPPAGKAGWHAAITEAQDVACIALVDLSEDGDKDCLLDSFLNLPPRLEMVALETTAASRVIDSVMKRVVCLPGGAGSAHEAAVTGLLGMVLARLQDLILRPAEVLAASLQDGSLFAVLVGKDGMCRKGEAIELGVDLPTLQRITSAAAAAGNRFAAFPAELNQETMRMHLLVACLERVRRFFSSAYVDGAGVAVTSGAVASRAAYRGLMMEAPSAANAAAVASIRTIIQQSEQSLKAVVLKVAGQVWQLVQHLLKGGSTAASPKLHMKLLAVVDEMVRNLKQEVLPLLPSIISELVALLQKHDDLAALTCARALIVNLYTHAEAAPQLLGMMSSMCTAYFGRVSAVGVQRAVEDAPTTAEELLSLFRCLLSRLPNETLAAPFMPSVMEFLLGLLTARFHNASAQGFLLTMDVLFNCISEASRDEGGHFAASEEAQTALLQARRASMQQLLTVYGELLWKRSISAGLQMWLLDYIYRPPYRSGEDRNRYNDPIVLSEVICRLAAILAGYVAKGTLSSWAFSVYTTPGVAAFAAGVGQDVQQQLFLEAFGDGVSLAGALWAPQADLEAFGRAFLKLCAISRGQSLASASSDAGYGRGRGPSDYDQHPEEDEEEGEEGR